MRSEISLLPLQTIFPTNFISRNTTQHTPLFKDVGEPLFVQRFSLSAKLVVSVYLRTAKAFVLFYLLCLFSCSICLSNSYKKSVLLASPTYRPGTTKCLSRRRTSHRNTPVRGCIHHAYSLSSFKIGRFVYKRNKP